MTYFKKLFPLIIILTLSFFAVKPLLLPGFFPMHDDTQVARVFEMGKVLQNGIFPVRFVPDLGYGYGYPIFNFYAPLAYYIGASFIFLGFDALLATKIMMALGIILAGLFMYFLAREFFGEFGGIVSGLFYLYAPYHALDIYVRGDVAEFWAYAFIPLAFLGFYRKNILLGSIGFAGLILSHNLTAMMVVPFLLIISLLNYYVARKNEKSFVAYRLLFIILLGLAISAFYWIPALVEMKYTNVLSQIGGGANFHDHFVCFSQLWSSPWGFGGSAKGCIDGMSFMIGKLNILAAITAFVFMCFFLKVKKSKNGTVIVFSFLGFLISAFLTLEISRPIWETIPAMAFFQYPWRFLMLASFFSSMLAGSLIFLSKQFKIKSYLAALLMIFLLLFFNLKFFVPQVIVSRTVNDYTNETTLKWTVSKISDEYLPSDFRKPKSLNDVYKGQSTIRVQETPVEKVSNLISIIGLLALFLGIILFKG